MKKSAKVTKIISKLLKATAETQLSFCPESLRCGTYSALVGCLCLTSDIRSFWFGFKSAPEMSSLSPSQVRMGTVL